MPATVLVEIRPIRTNVLRARFDKPPRAFDPSGYHDALNPRNWLIARIGGGFAPPSVRVDAVDGEPRSVDVLLLSDLDPDVEYDVTASSSVEAP